ncbi:hypothetical protein SacxiDRAFT_4017 [Saccharomonospora xinjiangensis XJ-54]|uniref:Uncharacterized protein n=1 Tax=Saccharomonospora xinjiangensis XJ-54 TaxID=882086 RepID=I0V7V4_9PSEU|nr:hypothetical protein SacxiDRAFT_4017 [Saccharomonospora xinjiangensis XJ-54]
MTPQPGAGDSRARLGYPLRWPPSRHHYRRVIINASQLGKDDP